MENQKIVNYLFEKKFRPHNYGFRYSYEAIEYCLKKGCVPPITREVYPYVAKKLGTTASRVERAIRHELEPRGVTNKEFIATAIIELSRKNLK